MYVLKDVSFICHPNTGSRSLREVLRKHNAEEVLGHHEVCPKRAAQTRACVCVVRNPFTLMGSWYQRGDIPNPFSIWLSNTLRADRHHEGPLVLGLFYGTLWATNVLKFESLQEDLDAACDELDLPRLPLNHVGKNRRPLDYRRLYWAEPETKNMIQAAYAHHLHAFNYKL